MKLNLEAINKVFISHKDFNIDDVYFINEGLCYLWAYTAYCLFGGSLYSTYCHAYIKIDNKYYDSESLDGCLDWRDLRVHREALSYNSSYLVSKKLTEEKFFEDWNFDKHDNISLLSEIRKTIILEG